jgi:hypothetical protein
VLIAFYRARREVEVVGIGGAAAVNGVLNGAVTRVKEGEEMRPSKGGRSQSSRLHGTGGREGAEPNTGVTSGRQRHERWLGLEKGGGKGSVADGLAQQAGHWTGWAEGH